MVEIGPRPILWHIMKAYASHGFNDFLIATGYRGELISGYFHAEPPRVSEDLKVPGVAAHTVDCQPDQEWSVCVVDTGLDTMTGGRVKRLRSLIGESRFMVTYGDGVSDVNLRSLLEFHDRHGKIATVTAVHPTARFGALTLTGEAVTQFSEKPQTDTGWINGGFFVFEPGIFDYLGGNESILEREPLERLTAENELMAFRHHGFWQPMDTPRERDMLNALWISGEAPWKTWE